MKPSGHSHGHTHGHSHDAHDSEGPQPHHHFGLSLEGPDDVVHSLINLFNSIRSIAHGASSHAHDTVKQWGIGVYQTFINTPTSPTLSSALLGPLAVTEIVSDLAFAMLLHHTLDSASDVKSLKKRLTEIPARREILQKYIDEHPLSTNAQKFLGAELSALDTVEKQIAILLKHEKKNFTFSSVATASAGVGIASSSLDIISFAGILKPIGALTVKAASVVGTIVGTILGPIGSIFGFALGTLSARSAQARRKEVKEEQRLRKERLDNGETKDENLTEADRSRVREYRRFIDNKDEQRSGMYGRIRTISAAFAGSASVGLIGALAGGAAIGALAGAVGGPIGIGTGAIVGAVFTGISTIGLGATFWGFSYNHIKEGRYKGYRKHAVEGEAKRLILHEMFNPGSAELLQARRLHDQRKKQEITEEFVMEMLASSGKSYTKHRHESDKTADFNPRASLFPWLKRVIGNTFRKSAPSSSRLQEAISHPANTEKVKTFMRNIVEIDLDDGSYLKTIKAQDDRIFSEVRSELGKDSALLPNLLQNEEHQKKIAQLTELHVFLQSSTPQKPISYLLEKSLSPFAAIKMRDPNLDPMIERFFQLYPHDDHAHDHHPKPLKTRFSAFCAKAMRKKDRDTREGIYAAAKFIETTLPRLAEIRSAFMPSPTQDVQKSQRDHDSISPSNRHETQHKEKKESRPRVEEKGR